VVIHCGRTYPDPNLLKSSGQKTTLGIAHGAYPIKKNK
jgi:hypothetical protein